MRSGSPISRYVSLSLAVAVGILLLHSGRGGTTMAKSGTRGSGALRRALELLKKVPMVDGHNDLPWVIRRDPLAQGDVLKYGLSRRHNDGDTDIPRLRQGRVGGQIWAAYVPTDIEHPARSVLEQIDVILRINAAHPDVFLPATRAS